MPPELTVQGADRFYKFKSDNDHLKLVFTTKSVGARGCDPDDPGSIPGQGVLKGLGKIGLFRKGWI